MQCDFVVVTLIIGPFAGDDDDNSDDDDDFGNDDDGDDGDVDDVVVRMKSNFAKGTVIIHVLGICWNEVAECVFIVVTLIISCNDNDMVEVQ